MNSFLLLLSTVAASAQVGMNSPPPGVKYGWKMENDGALAYIAQVPREVAEQMANRVEEIALDVPDFLQGKVSRVIWRIGTAEVEREPSEAELRAFPSRTVLPKSSDGSIGPSGLTNLRGTSEGQTVMIDRTASAATALQNASIESTSSGDTGFPSVPSLAQNFSSPNSRSPLSNPFDTSAGGAGTGSKQVLPRQDTLPRSFGVTASTANPYTTNPITVNGTMNAANGSSAWSDSRFGNTGTGSYGATNPIANGTFGNPGNYGQTNSSSVYASTAVPSFASTSSTPYGTTNPSVGVPTTASPANTNFGSFAANGSNPALMNQRPDAYLASNGMGYASNAYPNNGTAATAYATNPYANPAIPNGSNYPGQSYPQAGINPMTYANPTGTTYPGLNSAVLPPSIPYVASNTPTVNRQVVGDRRTSVARDDYPYETTNSPSQDFVWSLVLLVSLVGNGYLLMQLKHLLQRYRALQASNRGISTLTV